MSGSEFVTIGLQETEVQRIGTVAVSCHLITVSALTNTFGGIA